MILESSKFTPDEARSNPMVVAMRHPDCPINGVCLYLSAGFGSIVKHCEHLHAVDDAKAECKHPG